MKMFILKFIAGGYSIKMRCNKNKNILLHRVEYGSNELAGEMYNTRATACDIAYHIYSVKIKEKHSGYLKDATLIEYAVSSRDDADNEVSYKYRKYIVICDAGMYISDLLKGNNE
ncbi:hypothetical protein [Clostridium sp. AM49-4BH]|uniref:hypothetical protein n=1 Tax=Clostridium sp. AM49-4BH TaxID=2293035 RepID=UPI0011C22869|nr:hypothetical protein [Clostridium sp. AM49-4BH]